MVTVKELFNKMASGHSLFERDPGLGRQEVVDKRYDALVRQRKKQLMDEHARVLEREIVEHQRMLASRQLYGDGTSPLGKKPVVAKKDMEYYGKSNILR